MGIKLEGQKARFYPFFFNIYQAFQPTYQPTLHDSRPLHFAFTNIPTSKMARHYDSESEEERYDEEYEEEQEVVEEVSTKIKLLQTKQNPCWPG